MIRRPPRSTRTDTLFPYTPLFRSDRVLPIFIFHPQRARDHRVHVVEAGDVGEFENLLVVPEGLELVEDLERHAPAGLREAVGIGEHRALLFVIAVRDLPVRDRRDLLFANAEAAQRLAMLRKDELAALDQDRARLTKFAENRVDRERGVAVYGEAFDRMVQTCGHRRETRPTVAGWSGSGYTVGSGAGAPSEG